jgi:CheY-like chemotaxis protein
MTTPTAAADVASELATDLPYLRRYARALTGTQSSGDRYALATLEAVVADASVISDAPSPKIGLFRAFHIIWASSGAPTASDGGFEDVLEERAHSRLSALQSNTREALLLSSVEGFAVEDVASIMQTSVAEAGDLIERAQSDMADELAGRVMVIEDEAIIAMDLQSIVTSMGHEVTGIARTHDQALDLGRDDTPDLILADIQLADKSSGIDAVNALLGELGDRPVIFITAFPERLLTGTQPEPAFLITKPYSEEQVRAAVSQAMFFSTTEGLDAVG